MPFHIDYTGHAAVSAFMRVEKLKIAETAEAHEEASRVSTEPIPTDVEMELPRRRGQAVCCQPPRAHHTRAHDRPPRPTMRGKEKASGLEPASTSTRRRGRLTRSAASSSKPIEIADEDDATMEDVVPLENSAPTSTVDTQIPAEDNSFTRRLLPSAQFTSFTLWQSDRVVDTNRDEYYRSLAEWVSLANEARPMLYMNHRGVLNIRCRSTGKSRTDFYCLMSVHISPIWRQVSSARTLLLLLHHLYSHPLSDFTHLLQPSRPAMSPNTACRTSTLHSDRFLTVLFLSTNCKQIVIENYRYKSTAIYRIHA